MAISKSFHFLKSWLIGGIMLGVLGCNSQETPSPLENELLSGAYEKYKEKNLTQRRFGHETLLPLIENRKSFDIQQLGESVEGLPIFSLNMGSGDVRVMLWSQMHGNESTATMALFDLFNFFEGREDDGFEDIRAVILENLRIKFIPMVNPDGAEKFQRRNALDIDLNRDAISLSSPEAQILKATRDNFDPAFGFNLHDQNIYYNTKGSPNPATISVLAPAYDDGREINAVRLNAMKVIVGMNRLLQQEIPGHVGKYDDAFEPRAFGDNFQKWGTSTILIESGGYPGDPEKQYIRKLNFMIILRALHEIATGTYQNHSEEDYFAIPDNDSKLMDLVIRNIQLVKNDYYFRADIGVRQREVNADGKLFFLNGIIEDLGDLSVFYGYKELDATGLELVPGKPLDTPLAWEEITEGKVLEILRKGYLAVKSTNVERGRIHGFPLKIFSGNIQLSQEPGLGRSADFLLKEGDKLRYAVVNGYLIDLLAPLPMDLYLMVE